MFSDNAELPLAIWKAAVVDIAVDTKGGAIEKDALFLDAGDGGVWKAAAVVEIALDTEGGASEGDALFLDGDDGDVLVSGPGEGDRTAGCWGGAAAVFSRVHRERLGAVLLSARRSVSSAIFWVIRSIVMSGGGQTSTASGARHES